MGVKLGYDWQMPGESIMVHIKQHSPYQSGQSKSIPLHSVPSSHPGFITSN